ncbi:MAG: response regulator, partial [Kiritimatiellia bacterium]
MKPKVWIVDDDEELRTHLRWALTDSYQVLLAEDRASATEIVETNQPDVVLLDLGLPPHRNDVQEGLETLRQIQRAFICHMIESPVNRGWMSHGSFI